METPKHVILFSYSPTLKTHVSYPALVIGSRELEDHDYPVLALVHFRHDDTASHHALNGVDWADTLERTLDVPHEDDKDKQSFYYVYEEDAATLREQLESAREVLAEYDKVVDKLRAELAATTEGKDKALQALADATAAKPGPALVTETKNYSDGSSATGPAPLPDQSPAQQDAENAASEPNPARSE
jgi:hypothetical protein